VVASPERDKESAGAVEPHQAGDVVGDQHTVVVRRDEVVPRGPCAAMSGQHRFVGVQLGVVGAVGNRPEHRAFLVGGFGEHRQRLLRMGGDDHRIENACAVCGYLNTVGTPSHRRHGVTGAHLVDPGEDGLDVVGRAADHGAPRW
jgi:hypothetical protein